VSRKDNYALHQTIQQQYEKMGLFGLQGSEVTNVWGTLLEELWKILFDLKSLLVGNIM
jgi:hypothetical protein